MNQKNYQFKPEFEAKLRKLRVKQRFVRNIINHAKDFRITDLQARFRKVEDTSHWRIFIDNAFVWRTTPEGHSFWRKIYGTT